MDPLSIQMALGSPPALRGKISLSTIIGRKKNSPDSDKSSTTKTPKRLSKIDERPPSTPTRPRTVRMRRGFRPLSVITNSVLLSFELDTIKAMQELTEGDRKPAADNDKDLNPEETVKANPQASLHCPLEMPQTLAELPFSNQSEISLRAFLAQSSPPATMPEDIKGPFSSLYHVPAPDVSQHPAYSPNAFTSQSDVPSLITTSSPNEIKKFASRTRTSSSRFTDRTSVSSEVLLSSDRKKLAFFDKLQSPNSSYNRASTTSTEASPLAKRQPKSCPIEISYTPETLSSDSEKKRTASGGLRKFSDIFKSRVGHEKAVLPLAVSVNESPNAAKKKMEEYLRRVTCSPTYPYSDTSWLPRHPVTGRFWRSRNLKCTNCVNVGCCCCGRTCCAYKAATLALETHKDNPQGRDIALERIQQITMVFPYGRELPTFLQCTFGGGEGSGCGKLVCPECCGVCPDEICADIQCRKCKRNPWAECDWHSDSTQLSQTVNAISRGQTV